MSAISLSSVALYLVLLGSLALGFVLGMRRSDGKALFRLVTSLIGVLLTAILARILAGSAVEPLLSLLELPEELTESQALSEPLLALIKMGGGLLLYALLFFPILWLTRLGGFLLSKKLLSPEDRARRSFNLTGALIGMAASLAVTLCALSPLAVLAEPLDGAMAITAATDGMTSDIALVKDATGALTRHPLSVLSRLVGGKTAVALSTSVKACGVRTNLSTEAGALGKLLHAGASLVTTSDSWTEKEVGALQDGARALSSSRLVPATLSAMLREAEAAWSAEEEFLDIPRPEIDEAFEPLMMRLIHKLGEDAEVLSRGMVTVADLIEVLYRHGALAIEQDDEGAMLRTISKQELIRDLLSCIMNDPTLGELLPEAVHAGIRTVGREFGMPQTKGEIFEMVCTDLRGAYLVAYAAGEEEQFALLTDRILAISQDYSLRIDVMGACYLAAAMLQDLKGPSTDVSDVSKWLMDYAHDRREVTDGGMVSYRGRYPVSKGEIEADGERVVFYGYSDDSVVAVNGTGSVRYATAQALGSAFAGLNLRIHDGSLTLNATNGSGITVKDSGTALNESTVLNLVEFAGVGDAATLGAWSDLRANLPRSEDVAIPRGVVQALKTMKKEQGISYGGETSCHTETLSEYLEQVLFRYGMSVGAIATATDAAHLKTNRVCLADYMIFDGADMDVEGVSGALSGMLGGLGALYEAGDEMTMTAASEIISGIDSALRAMAPAKSLPSLMGAVLHSDLAEEFFPAASDSMPGLTDALQSDPSKGSAVLTDMSKTVEALKDLGGAPSEGQVKQAVGTFMEDITPDGAGALAQTVTPALLKDTFGMDSEEQAEEVCALLKTLLTHLSEDGLKEDAAGMEAEKSGVTLLLMTQTMDLSEKEGVFGANGALGTDAKTAIERLMGARSVTETARFRYTDPASGKFELIPTTGSFNIPALSGEEKQELKTAMRAYYDAHASSLPEAESTADLAIFGGEMTRNDLARDLSCIGHLFGVDPELEGVDLPEAGAVRVIRMEGEAGGCIVITAMRDGSLVAMAENGGIEGIHSGDGPVEMEALSEILVGRVPYVAVSEEAAARFGLTVTID